MTMARDDPMKILLAGTIGFAAGLLFAPRSGMETRAQLRNHAEEARMRMMKAKEQLRQQAAETTNQMKDAASSVAQRTKSMKDAAMDGAEQAKEDMKTEADTPSSRRTPKAM